MDDTRSKPTFFERLISRLAGEPDSAEDVLSLLRQAHEQEVFDADTLLRLEKVLDFADLEVRDAMITRSHMNVLKENDSIERITAYVIETAHSRFPVIGEDKDEVLGTPKTCSNTCSIPSSSTSNPSFVPPSLYPKANH